jgi:hypothetical protein
MRLFVRSLALLLVPGFFVSPASGSSYDGSPNWRSSWCLTSFVEITLIDIVTTSKDKNGWNLFLKQGAHFTDCYYDYANLVTAAGQASVGTGAYTDGHQIPLNPDMWTVWGTKTPAFPSKDVWNNGGDLILSLNQNSPLNTGDSVATTHAVSMSGDHPAAKVTYPYG